MYCPLRLTLTKKPLPFSCDKTEVDIIWLFYFRMKQLNKDVHSSALRFFFFFRSVYTREITYIAFFFITHGVSVPASRSVLDCQLLVGNFIIIDDEAKCLKNHLIQTLLSPYFFFFCFHKYCYKRTGYHSDLLYENQKNLFIRLIWVLLFFFFFAFHTRLYYNTR